MKERNNGELSLEELEMATRYPGVSRQLLPDLNEETEITEAEKEELKTEPELNENDLFVTENERLVNELPYGELSEDDLDNVLGGRYR